MSLHIVLVEPEIPNNTGNIGRLSLAAGASLHLIRPLGFDLSDSRVKRAGLDYWKHVDLHIYDDFESFLDANTDGSKAFFTNKGSSDYWDIDFTQKTYLIFGKESNGLSEDILAKYQKNTYRIPIASPKIRSLNLANAVSVVVYEGIRQRSRKKK